MENIIQKSKCALVIVDMQNMAVQFYSASNPDVSKNCRKMVDFAHEQGIPVLYTMLNRRPDVLDQVPWMTDGNLQMGSIDPLPVFVEGTKDAELVPELQPEARDFIVVKRRTSAFYGSPLELYLRALGVETILLAGVSTEMGVESTARSARDMNFDVVILCDCCASTNALVHEHPIKHIFPTIARCMDMKQAMEAMRDE